MKIVTFAMKGVSRYSQSRNIQSQKGDRETAATFEERVWRERMHIDEEGRVYIPPMAIKNALAECAKFLGIGVPGKGKATYTKHFEAGILCLEPAIVHDKSGRPVMGDSVQGEWLHVPSDGRRGGGKRVHKCFPYVESGWQAKPTVLVLDEMVTPEIMRLHLVRMGQYIGIGRFRPRNNGFYGRFNVSDIQWSEMDDGMRDAA